MKKIYKNILFWAVIALIVFSTILARPLNNLDELWNFNMARCISNGLVPYKDISMIITPLASFISAGVLKIFGTEMFFVRILAGILAMINLVLVYRILRNLKVNKLASLTLVIGILLIGKNIFSYDYNWLILTFSLLVILFEIKAIEKSNKKIEVLIGLMGGLAFCTKQTIGTLICIAILIIKLFSIKSKADIKEVLKNKVLFRFIGIMIPVFILTIYLIATKAFIPFWDYCIAGITTFTNKLPYKYLLEKGNVYSIIFSIIVPLTIVISAGFCVWGKIKKKNIALLAILTVYSTIMFFMVFPISDDMHFAVASIPSIALIAYGIKLVVCFLGAKLNKKINLAEDKFVQEVWELALLLFVIIFAISLEITSFDTLSNLSKYREINNFKYIHVDGELKSKIDSMHEYISTQQKTVYILDANAALYMIPEGRYTKDYDMFLNGNFGKGGEDLQIEKIKNEDAQFLIINDEYSRNWQNPEKVRAYVKENLELKGSVDIYDVYENKVKTKESTETQDMQDVPGEENVEGQE